MHFERRTFPGQTATQVVDGYAGFRLGKHYHLSIAPQPGGLLRVADADAPANAPTGGAIAIVTPEQFDRWWTT